jgi:hypothetical protein
MLTVIGLRHWRRISPVKQLGPRMGGLTTADTRSFRSVFAWQAGPDHEPKVNIRGHATRPAG